MEKMSSETEMKTWVSDRLMTLMGYSNATVVQYVIAVSKKASSVADLAGKLLECGLSESDETRRFAEELFSTAPHKASGMSTYQKQEREVAMFVKKQKTYSVLEADTEYVETEAPSTGASSHSKKVSGKKKRFRKTNNADEEEDGDEEEVNVQRKEEKRVKRKTSNEDDRVDESDEEVRRDRRERKQLEKSLRDRDAAGTCKLMEQKMSKKDEEEAIRRSKALEEDSLETLRKVSRQEYLKKREQKKLDELGDAIEDEMYLFEGQKPTESELHEFSMMSGLWIPRIYSAVLSVNNVFINTL